ncbi:hypothetical protein TruAng_011576 [Truncatella angustata]|nr:hypothetical protein TruAng_011576 [Truncatella angustata]
MPKRNATTQKNRVHALEQMAASVLASSSSLNASAGHAATDAEIMDTSTRATINVHSGSSSNHNMLAKALSFPVLFSFSRDELIRCVRIMASEGFGLRHIVKYGLISLGYGMAADLFDQASQAPSQRWIELVKLSYGGIDMKLVVSRGITLLGRLRNPPAWPSLETLRATCPNPPSTITLSVVSILSAQLLNMQFLDISPDMLWDEDSVSPLYDPHLEKDGASLNGHGCIRTIPRDLQPTTNQRLFPHHPYLDLIPWPIFRSNVIAAISLDPPMIDEDDLCLDLTNDGFRCWGTTMGSLHGRGEGVPWDCRSWEATPWFLEKWQCLTGGEDGEMSRNSAWWRSMQGMS